MKKITAHLLLSLFALNVGHVVAAEPTAEAAARAATIAGEFVSKLPVGTNLRLKLDDGTKYKATLMGVENDVVVIKLRTRIPEPPIKVALNRIVDADVDRGSSLGKSIAIGAAAGAGAALGVIMLLIAAYAD